MDKIGKEYNGEKIDDKKKPLTDVDSQNVLLNGEGEEDDETVSLLDKPRKGGLSSKVEKTQRKVQWNDNNGNKLVEVLEFQPSDGSDSDEEESDSCICRIM